MGLHVNDHGLHFPVSVLDGKSVLLPDLKRLFRDCNRLRSISRKVNCGKHHGTHVCIDWLKNVNLWSQSATIMVPSCLALW